MRGSRAFCPSVLLAVLAAGGLVWSAHCAARAYVAVAVDVANAGVVMVGDVYGMNEPNPTRVIDVDTHDSTYRVRATSDVDCRVGVTCELSLMLMPAEGWRANPDYPYKFQAHAEPGLAFETSGGTPAKPTYGRMTGHVELQGGAAIIRVVVRPTIAGPHRIAGRLHVSVCRADLCRVGRHELVVDLRAS